MEQPGCPWRDVLVQLAGTTRPAHGDCAMIASSSSRVMHACIREGWFESAECFQYVPYVSVQGRRGFAGSRAFATAMLHARLMSSPVLSCRDVPKCVDTSASSAGPLAALVAWRKDVQRAISLFFRHFQAWKHASLQHIVRIPRVGRLAASRNGPASLWVARSHARNRAKILAGCRAGKCDIFISLCTNPQMQGGRTRR